MSQLHFRNPQRVRPIDLRLLRRIVQSLLVEDLRARDFELCFHLIGADRMSRINSTFLQHEGSTDVITFDHAGGTGLLVGEAFISIEDAVSQARQFRTTWPEELVRYLVHAILHLTGEDDRTPPARRRMKRRENRLVRGLARRFPLSRLSRRPRLRP